MNNKRSFARLNSSARFNKTMPANLRTELALLSSAAPSRVLFYLRRCRPGGGGPEGGPSFLGSLLLPGLLSRPAPSLAAGRPPEFPRPPSLDIGRPPFPCPPSRPCWEPPSLPCWEPPSPRPC